MYYDYSYEVDDVTYALRDCAQDGSPAPVGVVTYSPDDPSQAILNTQLTWRWIWLGLIGFGLLMLAMITLFIRKGI